MNWREYYELKGEEMMATPEMQRLLARIGEETPPASIKNAQAPPPKAVTSPKPIVEVKGKPMTEEEKHLRGCRAILSYFENVMREKGYTSKE